MSRLMHEILEQPGVLARTLEGERAHAREFARHAASRDFRLIMLVARGSSDHAAMFGRYLLEIATGIPCTLCAPSIHTLYRARVDLKQTLVIGISQSGESEDVNRVLKSSRQRGAFAVGITGQANSAMARLVDEVFLSRAGRQRAVPATKAYTAELLLLYLLASALGSRVTPAGISEIPGLVAEALKLEAELRQIVERYRYMRQCVVIARGLNYATAREMATKLVETCRVVAEPVSSADLLYGPISLIERGFPAILFMPPGKPFPELKRLAERLWKLQADTLVFSAAGVRLPAATRTVRLPGSIPEMYTPIPYIVPAQLFAALLAETKGLDPDKPRSLQIITRGI